MEAVKKPKYIVTYEGKNITADLNPYMMNLSYTDNVSGKSDAINLELSDSDGLWRNQWIPTKGDLIDVKIGFDDYVFPCGVFEVDELQLSGVPHKVTIAAIAAPISKSIRTRNNYAHEEKTLAQIAAKVANDHGFTVSGLGNDSFVIIRVTQYQETDLAFLERLSRQYGYIFSVRNDQLIFTSIYDLENGSSIMEINREDLTSYSIKDKTAATYKSARVRYSGPDSQSVIEGSANGFSEGKNDVLEVWTKVETVKQAEEIAESVLHIANTGQQTARFSLPGDTRILSGINFELTGLGRLSGKWHVTQSTHNISPTGGYKVSFNAKKNGEIDVSKWL